MEIANGLKYQYYQNGEIVMNYGDEADRFYLILDGNADVYIPDL